MAFPAGRHDDQVELDRAGARLEQEGPAEPGIIGYWRRLAEEVE